MPTPVKPRLAVESARTAQPEHPPPKSAAEIAHTRAHSAAAAVALNANRHVTGVLRGFDQFMNLVLDGTVDIKSKQDIGMVVRTPAPSAKPEGEDCTTQA